MLQDKLSSQNIHKYINLKKWFDKIPTRKMVNILWNEAESLGLTFKLSEISVVIMLFSLAKLI